MIRSAISPRFATSTDRNMLPSGFAYLDQTVVRAVNLERKLHHTR